MRPPTRQKEPQKTVGKCSEYNEFGDDEEQDSSKIVVTSEVPNPKELCRGVLKSNNRQ